MKTRAKLILSLAIAIIALFVIAPFAYADDPPDIKADITIVGDNADVDVDVIGDNPEVWINGININDPIAVYNVITGASQGWVKTQISNAITGIQDWMDEANGAINLTASGLASVILSIETTNGQVATWFSSADKRADWIEGRLDTLADTERQDYVILTNRLDSYRTAFIIAVAGCGVLALFACVAGVGIAFWIRKDKERK